MALRTASAVTLSLLLSGGVVAETLVVDPDNCEGAKRHCAIQVAIDAANPGDTVRLTAGVYNLWQESLVIGKTLTLEGEGPMTTLLDGDGKAPAALITVTAEADSVTLSQLSVIGRVIVGSPTMGPGGLEHKGNDLRLDRVHFNNNGGGWGGAVRISTLFGSVVVERCRFDGNTAFAGGGIAAYDGSAAEITITESTFHKNNAVFSGGGLLMRDIDEVVLDQVTFTDNQSGNSGGGAHFFTDTGHSDVQIRASHITGNRASKTAGISAFGDNVSVAVIDSRVLNNHSSDTPAQADCDPEFVDYVQAGDTGSSPGRGCR